MQRFYIQSKPYLYLTKQITSFSGNPKEKRKKLKSKDRQEM